ncbi:hypothetical protein ACFXTH_044557 [Malus domestica]
MHCFFKLGKPDEANRVFQDILRTNLTPHPATFNIMINGLLTYNILIHGLRKARRLGPARRMLKELGESGYEPNAITYTTVMKCCFKFKQYDEGLEIMSEMKSKGSAFDGFACCTDVAALVKTGRIEEANACMEQTMRNGVGTRFIIL